ncbi:hypothetical protein LTR36_000001, partial [Oleoguttula mirabilis]
PGHHYGRDAALGGGAGAAGVGAYELSKDQDDKLTAALGPSKASSASAGGQGYPSQTTSTRNDLSSEQPGHHYGRDAALGGGAGAAGVSAYELSGHKAYDEKLAAAGGLGTSNDLVSEQPKHHYGRDAAIGGGAGAAGVGAYELSKNHGDNLASTNLSEDPSSSQYTGGHHYPNQKAREELGAPSEAPQHHYGRDAAVAGGAGAAGVGAYEVTKDHGDTGPATKTTGPHSSNIANVVDPRVQPDMSKAKTDSAQAAEKDQHHYGRDAAVAGGAGAVGVGAYEATKGRGEENAAPVAQEQAAASQHDHNKLHKKNDPRGQEYPQHTDDKHEKELQKAREKEAAKGGDHGEKKEGFLHKLLHHGDKDKHAKEEVATGAAPEHERGRHMGTDGPIGDSSNVGGLGATGNTTTGNTTTGNTADGVVIEPHTGLPMNVGKHGTYGGGGTDGAKTIEGYHETDPAVTQAEHGTGEISHGHRVGDEGVVGPDWDAIKKKNTPY